MIDNNTTYIPKLRNHNRPPKAWNWLNRKVSLMKKLIDSLWNFAQDGNVWVSGRFWELGLANWPCADQRMRERGSEREREEWKWEGSKRSHMFREVCSSKEKGLRYWRHSFSSSTSTNELNYFSKNNIKKTKNYIQSVTSFDRHVICRGGVGWV